MGEGGSFGVGTSPPGALAHLPCCHTKGDTIRVGLKDRYFVYSPGKGVADGRAGGGQRGWWDEVRGSLPRRS